MKDFWPAFARNAKGFITTFGLLVLFLAGLACYFLLPPFLLALSVEYGLTPLLWATLPEEAAMTLYVVLVMVHLLLAFPAFSEDSQNEQIWETLLVLLAGFQAVLYVALGIHYALDGAWWSWAVSAGLLILAIIGATSLQDVREARQKRRFGIG